VSKAALLHQRWLRRAFTLVVSLLGGGFAILCQGQVGSPTVEPGRAGQKVELPATPSPQVPNQPITEAVPSRTASPQLPDKFIYLQLSATRRQDADLMIEHLRRKNFEAVVFELKSRPGIYRVLVGPVKGNGVLQLRANLERAGFHGKAALRLTSVEPILPKPENAISSSDKGTKEGVNDSTGTGILDSAEPFSGTDIQRNPVGSDPANADAVKSSSDGSTKTDASNRSGDRQMCLEFDAISPQTAGIIADALRAKGFDVTISAIEEAPGEFRVLIRPAKDTSIDQLREDLERAGFHGNAATLRSLK
jgi:hypothetical protein